VFGEGSLGGPAPTSRNMGPAQLFRATAAVEIQTIQAGRLVADTICSDIISSDSVAGCHSRFRRAHNFSNVPAGARFAFRSARADGFLRVLPISVRLCFGCHVAILDFMATWRVLELAG